jgi:hypothetical protein
MSIRRSIMLLVLAFAAGFCGYLFVHLLRSTWQEVMHTYTFVALAVLAAFWGSPRGLLERKWAEAAIGAGVVFVGVLTVAYVAMPDTLAPYEELVAKTHVPVGVWTRALQYAILGLFVGGIDGLYELWPRKLIIGAVLAALLGAGAAFVEIPFRDASLQFIKAFRYGTALGLMHLGSVFAQMLCGARYDEEEDEEEDD